MAEKLLSLLYITITHSLARFLSGGCLKRNHKGYHDFDKLYTVNSLFSRWIPVVVGIIKTQKSSERMSDSDI
jgi:hypothetical protein